ncbi:MAG: (2Fe-2S)-binding protein [Candidatus Izemoplasmatales bacterium]
MSFMLNGTPITTDQDPAMRLLDFLRKEQHLTGTKEGCGEGECGACAILFDGVIAHSCLIPLANAADHDIVTIEGFSKTKRFEVIAQAFVEAGAVQCGFCTPGMIIATESLLRKNPHPTVHEIKEALSGNLCRCTGYQMIVQAVQIACEKGAGLWP